MGALTSSLSVRNPTRAMDLLRRCNIRLTGAELAIATFCLVLLGAGWALALERINYEREDTVRDAVRQNNNLAMAYEQQTIRTFQVIDQALRFLKLEYENEGAKLNVAGIFERGVIDGRIFSYAAIVDQQGRLVASNSAPVGLDLSDRDYFVFHRQNQYDGLLIGKPTISRVTGRTAIHMTRRVTAPGGGFHGVALVAIPPEYLSEYSQRMELGELGSTLLVGLDRVIRARRSGEVNTSGQEMSDSILFQQASASASGSLVSRGRTDGVARFISYRVLRDYPLIVSLGRSVDEALAETRVRARHYYFGGAAGTFLVLLSGAGLLVALRRHNQAQHKLRHQAHYDALTDLPNRVLCYDRLGQALRQAQRNDSTVGVLFVDLDRFKIPNDTLGHEMGDALLRETARRLQQCVRSSDTVARVGGDEFLIVLSELCKPQDAQVVAQKIVDTMAVPFAENGAREIFMSASVGIATCPPDGAAAASLIKNADAAMFRAKHNGGNNYQFYTEAMNEHAMETLLLENDLRRALEREEFVLHFQPKTSLVSGRVVGFEALIRWKRLGQSLVPPSEFVPLLEESGLIVPVGEWVIDTACAQIAAWQRTRVGLPVAVNLSAKQFLRTDIGAVIENAARKHGVEPHLLEVEITESDAMENADQSVVILRRLKALGIGIAIDDFGTGYSSLSYLKRFPVDKIKLDRSFVSGLPNNTEDASIARAVITMAHSLGLKVVAEGVEAEAQRGFLAAHGCDEMQGYLFARPLPAAECEQFLRPRLHLVAAA
jgi:diguanylate cyclase (GGDEF)-like protein